jgi:hypothetical protein
MASLQMAIRRWPAAPLPRARIDLAKTMDTSAVQDRARRLPDHPRLRAFVSALDDRLRLRHGVSEYTRSPDCIFRMQLGRAGREFTLSDGTRVRPADRIINLHLWNEQVPPFPGAGPTLGWARCLRDRLDISLRELALYLMAHRELDDIAGLCGNAGLGSAQSEQIVRVAARFGFERVADAPAALGERVHRFGENVLISMMVIALNSRALRADSLWRDRTVVFLSRKALQDRYAGLPGPEITGPDHDHDADIVPAGSRL